MSERGSKKFSVLESRMNSLKVDDLSIKDLIALSDELNFKNIIVAEEMLSRKNCDEIALRHILRSASKEPRQKAAKRLLEKYPTRDNLGMVIRYCEYYRHRAFEMLKEKEGLENAQAIFLNNIYKDE
jgi:hypothetical protein